MFKPAIYIVFLTMLVVSCQQASKESAPPAPPASEGASGKPAPRGYKAKAPAADAVGNANATSDSIAAEISPFESAVSKEQAIDTAKELIRTADMKFRAQSVLKAALQVERIAQQNGGFVLQNRYTENNKVKSVQRVAADSSKQYMEVEPTCHVVIRVLYRQLDTTLRSIGRLAEVLDYRNLEARDVSLDLMEQRLEALRNQSYGNAVEGDIAEKGKQLNDITAARERAFNARRGEDMANIERMRTEDQIRYSTVTVDIYEQPVHRTAMIGFYEPSDDWRPNFFIRIWKGLVEGCSLLINLMVGIVTIWPLVVLIGVVIWFWRKKQ